MSKFWWTGSGSPAPSATPKPPVRDTVKLLDYMEADMARFISRVPVEGGPSDGKVFEFRGPMPAYCDAEGGTIERTKGLRMHLKTSSGGPGLYMRTGSRLNPGYRWIETP